MLTIRDRLSMASTDIYQETLLLLKHPLTDFLNDLSEVVIPFSALKESHNIYNGGEMIPFEECHPEFQKIFLNEFLNVWK